MKIVKKIIMILLIPIVFLGKNNLVNALDFSSFDLNITTHEGIPEKYTYNFISSDKSIEFISSERKLISSNIVNNNGINYNHDIFLIGQNKITFLDKYSFIKSITYIDVHEEKTFDKKADFLDSYNKYINNQGKLNDAIISNNSYYSWMVKSDENKDLNNDYSTFISLTDDAKKIANEYVANLYGTNELVSFDKVNHYINSNSKEYTSVLYNNNSDVQSNLNLTINDLKNSNATVINSKVENVYNSSLDIIEKLPRETFNNKEQASNRAQELMVSNSIYEIVSNITSDLIYDKTISKDINTNYNDKNSLDNSVNLLKLDGYNVENLIISENTSLVKHSINEKFKDLTEATNKKNEFNKKYNAKASIENLVDKADYITNELEILSFETEEEANKYKLQLEKNNDLFHNVSAEVTIGKKDVYGASEEIKHDGFETEEEAYNYKSELENNGYRVSDFKVTKTTEQYKNNIDINNGSNVGRITDKNRVNLFLRLDGNVKFENGSTAYDNDDYVYVGSVGVNTPGTVYDINANSQNNNIEYLIANNNVIGTKVINSLTNIDIQESLKKYNIDFDSNNQVLVFYVLKDAVDGPVYHREYPKGNNGSIYVDLPSCKYHIDAVIRNKSDIKDKVITKYDVSGQQQLVTSKNIYNVSGTETIFGIKYLVSGSIDIPEKNGTYNLSGKVTKDIYKDAYYVDSIKTTFGYQQRYIINYTEPELDGYLLTIKSNRITYHILTNGEGYYNNYSIKEDINYEYEDVFEDIYNKVLNELPPYTGIEFEYNIYISLSCIACLIGLLNKKKII